MRKIDKFGYVKTKQPIDVKYYVFSNLYQDEICDMIRFIIKNGDEKSNRVTSLLKEINKKSEFSFEDKQEFLALWIEFQLVKDKFGSSLERLMDILKIENLPISTEVAKKIHLALRPNSDLLEDKVFDWLVISYTY